MARKKTNRQVANEELVSHLVEQELEAADAEKAYDDDRKFFSFDFASPYEVEAFDEEDTEFSDFVSDDL